MKYIILFLMLFLLLTATFAGATDSVEAPKNCTQCGMDRSMFAQSRMLVVYADRTAVGVCSLHCAAAELHNNKEKLVSALMVADFATKKLIDARSAVWVVGGRKSGVMTARAKWAFDSAEEARRFMAENGGTVNSFDQAMSAATIEVLEQAEEEKTVENEMLREMR
ncbi:MAG: nitrous oxide reductase accessory protein NosL [Pelobacteraceae bacterium]